MSAARKTPTVLVVDDDLVTNRMISGIIQQMGFHTICAGGFEQARSAALSHTPDLALLDVSLPDGSGFDLCRLLQNSSREYQTPVLFISAHDDTPSKVRGFEAGGVDYITKPIARAELAARVTTHLRLRHAYEALTELQAERLERLTSAQSALMPKPADLPEARFAVSISQIHQAGGDFYDVIPTGTGIVDYLVADVSGHDLAASYWTSALKTLLAQHVTPSASPGEILQGMNRILCRVLPPGVFFTATLARLNRKTRRLTLVNAGHPPAILTPGPSPSHPREPHSVLASDGDILGAFPDARFGSLDLEVVPGTRLYLYSDGLVESRRDRESGILRLATTCAKAASLPLPEAITHIVDQVTHGTPATDDVVILGTEA